MKKAAKSDFTTTMVVDKTPKQVFDAVTNVRGWWSEGVEGGTRKLNDEFIYRHTDIHYSKQKLVKVIPNKKVVWKITDSSLSFIKDKDEWTGTEVIFDIAKKGNKTELRFTHAGLIPQIECYNACSGGWSYYLHDSLLPLITKGKGKPDKRVKLKPKPKEIKAEDKDKSFTTTILVDQSPAEAFKAITNVRGWWSEEIEGGTEKLNDEFTYHYKDVHRSRIKLTEVIPGKKVVWLVMDNYFNFTKDKNEWKGNKIIFEISKKGKKTQIRFTHLGLVPDYECYNVCFDAWSGYIKGSLRNLIATGKGKPNPKEGKRNATKKK